MGLVLASASPRRSALLSQLGFTFEVAPSSIDESVRVGEAPRAYVERVAREKARRAAERFPREATLAADTAVVLEAQVLGKPGDDAQAAAVLRALSGRSHVVLTGVAVVRDREERGVVVATEVRFRTLTEREIAWYVETGEGRDKAGGYAMQGLAGAFVESITGSPSNVVGLPLAETVALLAQMGVPLPWEGRR